MNLVHAALSAPDAMLAPVALTADRHTLAKRLWRGVAADGVEFGFELERPLRHGDTVWQTATARYVIEQQPEPVLTVALAGLAPSAAAAIGWAVGNLHLDFSTEATRLLTPDEPAARQLFARLQISFTSTVAIFRAGRFARGEVAVAEPALSSASARDELGPSHRH